MTKHVEIIAIDCLEEGQFQKIHVNELEDDKALIQNFEVKPVCFKSIFGNDEKSGFWWSAQNRLSHQGAASGIF